MMRGNDRPYRPVRPTLRSFDRSLPRRVRRKAQGGNMGRQVRVRGGGSRKVGAPENGPYAQLWMPSPKDGSGREIQARPEQQRGADEGNPNLSYLVENEAALPERKWQSLGLLRWPGNCGLRRMVGGLPGFRAMGAEERISAAPYYRAQGQRRPIFSGKLPMGHIQRAGRQSAGAWQWIRAA